MSWGSSGFLGGYSMIYKQKLEKQLEDLRSNWKNGYPKSHLDSRWWRFKCDETLAIQIKENIRKIDAGIEVVDYDEIEKMFTS